jgi:hypothetical protein
MKGIIMTAKKKEKIIEILKYHSWNTYDEVGDEQNAIDVVDFQEIAD